MEVKLNELNSIFSKAFGAETNITADTVRDEIAVWDSINHLNLIVELEDHYHVSFSMDEIKEMVTVKKIITALEGKK